MVSCPATVVVMPSDCGVFRVKEASVWTRKQELRQARDDQAAEAECHTEAESCFQKLPPQLQWQGLAMGLSQHSASVAQTKAWVQSLPLPKQSLAHA